MRRTFIALVALVLVAGACTTNGATTTTGPGDSPGTTRTGFVPGLFASALQEFDSCDAFLAHIKAEAIERVGAYGLPGIGYYGGPVAFDVVALESRADDGGGCGRVQAASSPVAGQDYSTSKRWAWTNQTS